MSAVRITGTFVQISVTHVLYNGFVFMLLRDGCSAVGITGTFVQIKVTQSLCKEFVFNVTKSRVLGFLEVFSDNTIDLMRMTMRS